MNGPVATVWNTDISAAEKIAWLRLIRTDNVGPITFYRLIESYGSATRAIDAIPDLAKRGGRRAALKVADQSVVEDEIAALEKIGARIITAAEHDYPVALAALEDAPPAITLRGNAALMHKPCIGVVGSRNCSLNSRRFTEKLASDLGAAGQVVVSGLARGIDTSAHEGALATGTIAVVAGGIDVVYPPENQKLYEQIIERGLVVAESPFAQQPFAQSFPRRNRIISGLSSGVVVVEATERSGSLITARMAAEQGRDIYAVPGHPLDPRAAGPNKLIREGALLIRGADDIVEALSGFHNNLLRESAQDPFDDLASPSLVINDDPAAFEKARSAIRGALSFTPVAVDDLIRDTRQNVQMVQTVLLELELAGTAQRLPGNRVALLAST